MFDWLFGMLPLREAIGISIAGMPLRLGELLFLLFPIYCIFQTKNIHFNINKYAKRILLILLFFLIYSSLFSLINYSKIDSSYFIKTIFKGFLVLFFLVFAFTLKRDLPENKFIKYMKYIVILELCFYLIQAFGYTISFCKIEKYSPTVFMGIKRFQGTASEPGYLAPILALPLYFFSKKIRTNYLWFALTCILIILSFSLFNYIVLLMVVFSILWKYIKEISFKKLLLILLCIILSMTIIIAASSTIRNAFMGMINKGLQFLGVSNKSADFSANDRMSNYSLAFKMISEFNFFEIFVGRGTGAYSAYSLANREMVFMHAEEAYNLYLSTFTDRGIIGLAIMVLLIYNIYKLKEKDNLISSTVFFAILVQFIQYLLVGNIWLYFLWFEVAVLSMIKKDDIKEELIDEQ